MSDETVVFDAPTDRDRRRLTACAAGGGRTWVIQPFHAYHHLEGIRFFPKPLPAYVEELLAEGAVSALTAEALGSRDLYFEAAERAVAATEQVFPHYRRRQRRLCDFLVRALASDRAEDVFRKLLCEKLGVFFSLNMLFARIEGVFPGRPIRVVTHQDLAEYARMRSLAVAGGAAVAEHPRVRPWAAGSMWSPLARAGARLRRVSALAGMAALSVVPPARAPAKSYAVGMTIISPHRQFRDNQRGADFLVDESRLRPQDVVYVPLAPLTDVERRRLAAMGSDVVAPPDRRNPRSSRSSWVRLLGIALREVGAANEAELFATSAALAEYVRWKHLLRGTAMRHFVTHADFSPARIGRNIALNQAGTTTWYFTDASNFGLNFTPVEPRRAPRHPFWTYLNYDHLVTWYQALAEWLESHPSSFRQASVVGCLWGQHVREKAGRRGSRPQTIGGKDARDRFLVTAYGSTYTVKGITAYEEGLAFVRDLLRVADECPGVFIMLKDKKPPSMHLMLEPVLGRELLAAQEAVGRHSRMVLAAHDSDASALMAETDLIVSFPFTSTTFEALAADQAAIWHDPLGFYRDTPYGRVPGAVTHGYDELKSLVEELRAAGPGGFRNPFAPGSPLIDPFRDGRAIERFRELLTAPLERRPVAPGAAEDPRKPDA